MAITKCGAVGGTEGALFEDEVPSNAKKIHSIRVKAGADINILRCTWQLTDGTLSEGDTQGAEGGNVEDTFQLDSDEFLVGISGTAGIFVNTISFRTNKRQSQQFGGPGGNAYSFEFPANVEVIGFWGRVSDRFNTIGVQIRKE